VNLFEIDVDTSGLFRAMDQAVAAIERRTKVTAKDTADRVERNAKQRVARATGATAAGIHVEETYDGTGYVVLSRSGRADAGQHGRWPSGRGRILPGNHRGEHVAEYLEFGTVKMTARPFFFVSAEIEAAGHDRRMREAIADGIEEVGLGR